jgi:hypothetical protein
MVWVAHRKKESPQSKLESVEIGHEFAQPKRVRMIPVLVHKSDADSRVLPGVERVSGSDDGKLRSGDGVI